MATYYCTNAEVASLLQYTTNSGNSQARLTFSSSTLPTDTEVDDIINDMEDLIDEITGYTWKSKTITNEYHDYYSKHGYGRYYDRSGNTVYAIHPKKHPLKTMSSASGDKIEVWDGTSWNDFLTTYTLGSGMYDEDYWIDYSDDYGVIYLFNQFPNVGKNTIRLTYRIGASSVPNGIRLACKLMAGSQINERKELYMQQGKDQNPAINQAKAWWEKAMNILSNYKYEGVIEFI